MCVEWEVGMEERGVDRARKVGNFILEGIG